MSYASDHLAWQQRVMQEQGANRKFIERNILATGENKEAQELYEKFILYEAAKSNPNLMATSEYQKRVD